MQRIFKYGGIQNTSDTPDKELNIWIYRTPSYVIILKKLYTFKNGPVFFGAPYIMYKSVVLPLEKFTLTLTDFMTGIKV